MKRAWILLFVFAAAASTSLGTGCASRKPLPQSDFYAGVAVVDLTPSKNVPLGGYGGRMGRAMIGVHDPIYAKALYLETQDAKVCLITTDLIGSTVKIRDLVQPEGVQVILAASHNHSGPGALAEGLWKFAMGAFDQAFHDEVVSKLRKLIEAARAARRPARLAFAREEEPRLAKNRRTKGGPIDPEINVLVVNDDMGRAMAVLTNYTAHATILSEKNYLLSGDWPGYFQRELEKRIPYARALYTNGAEGDVGPRAPVSGDDFVQAEAMGRALAERVAGIVRDVANHTDLVKLRYVERGVELPPSPQGLLKVPARSVLGMLDINGVRMFCFPGEPCVELGLELKRRYPGSWILGLANDHLGYFLTEEGYEKGGYERTVSFYGPKMGPWLIEEFAKLGEGDHEKDRARQPEGGRGKNDDGR